MSDGSHPYLGPGGAVEVVDTAPDATATLSQMAADADLSKPLPTELRVTISFVRRLPTQRLLDAIAKYDPTPYGDLQEQMPSRVLAFRILVRDYPNRDIGSLWQHAYDCETEILDADPTLPPVLTPSPPSAPTST